MSKKCVKTIKPAYAVVGNLIYVDFHKSETVPTQAENDLEQKIINIMVKYRDDDETIPEAMETGRAISKKFIEKGLFHG